MPQIAYLVEPVRVTNTGKLQGKSLRAFEVEYWQDTTNHYHNPINIKPTGKVYTLKGNQIICKSTSATLKNKYLSNLPIMTSAEDVSRWRCRLYASPELAIIAKSIAVKTRTQELIATMEENLHTLYSLQDTSEFLSQHPEYLI